jgi:hypothetical protein
MIHTKLGWLWQKFFENDSGNNPYNWQLDVTEAVWTLLGLLASDLAKPCHL